MKPERMNASKHVASKHAALAAALLALAACGGKPDETPVPEASPPAPAAEAPAATPAPVSAPGPEAAPATDATPTAAPLQLADIDAYVRGMERENALLREEYGRIERARAADDAEAETDALFAMTSSDIDHAGAEAAGMAPARYGWVKDRIDEVQSRLDMIEGFRRTPGDSSALQAQVGDPYAAFAADVAAALKARQPQLAALRAEAAGLRLKAAGG